MIGIIDYGMGNVGSIYSMLKKIGHKSKICQKSAELNDCNKMILPGVGAFDNAMKNLQSLGFLDVIKQKISFGDYFLGVCLGMQLLGTSSEEGKLKGLNLIPGKILRFPNNKSLKVPHMGWNTVEYKSNFLDDINSYNRYYFVHSYYFLPEDPLHSIGETNYIINFTSFVQKENIMGVQFHPEKSHKYGMQFLKKFAELD